MPAYVALLRGINVGGSHRVPMADLRAAFTAYGARDVSTYIQSGNVSFTSDDSEDTLVSGLGSLLSDRFGFAIPVVIRELSELRSTAREHPLTSLVIDEKFLHVVFLAAEPSAEAVAAFDVASYVPDELQVIGRDVFVAYPAGSARSKLTGDVIQRALGSTATARNWRTVQKLVELGGALEG